MSPLEQAFRNASPRFGSKPIPPLGAAISTAIAGFWIVAFVAAFRADSLAGWGVGVAFIVYDVALALYVGVQALKIWRAPARSVVGVKRPSLGVIVAAYNEGPALAATLDALLAQTEPPERIWLADDGSTDDSARVLAERYRLTAPPVGAASAPSPQAPALRWLRLLHRGKARALNAALAEVDTEIVVTVDADTLLEPDALAELRDAFAADPALDVGGGVLVPRCAGGASAKLMQTFQRIEYVRNFLGRYAWTEPNALVLVSGAFAAFRASALKAVGGFDPLSLVEDYELIHRLHRHARTHGLDWRVGMVGRARGDTDAPATLPAFLRQRRRWFAGFLQTHYAYRELIGAPRYRALGLAMMPVKTLDTAQPLYGLAAFALLIYFVATGRYGAALPAGGLVLAKIGFDFGNLAFLLAAYRRWTGGRAPVSLPVAWACLIVEPFTFQALRHLGAARGWVAILAGRLEWGRASRTKADAEEGAAGA